MSLTRVYPGESEAVDLDDRERLLELYRPERPTDLRLNLITSLSGALGGADGTSHSLSNPVDRRILGVIRELADVVLVGAQTVRSEGYLLPRRAALAILTASGDLTGHAIETSPDSGRLIVVTTAESVDRAASHLPDAEIVVLDEVDGRIRPGDAVGALRDRGLAAIVSEGGPGLAAALLDAGLVDEFCLSTAPVINGSSVPTLASVLSGVHDAELRQLLVEPGGATYARWSLRRAGSASS